MRPQEDRLSTDQLLLRADRDPDAFAVLYRRMEGPLLSWFLRRGTTPELAADLTAEVFAAVLVAGSRFKADGPPAEAWIFGVAHNVLGASRRRGRVANRARRRLGVEPVTLTDASIERIEELVDAQRSAALLQALLESLPADQRTAVRAHVIDDRDYDELASELACSEAVLRQRVSRGLRNIRRRLEASS